MQQSPSKKISGHLHLLLLLFSVSTLITALLTIVILGERLHRPDPPVLSASDPVAQSVKPDSSRPDPPEKETAPGLFAYPALALVLDDMGASVTSSTVQGFFDLPVPFTVSILPGSGARFEVAELAMRAGKELQLHLPMEPEGSDYGTYDFLLRSDTPPESLAVFLDALLLPGDLVGLNNHMGSAATRNLPLMRAVARWAGSRGWYVLDSVTHPQSVLYYAAQQEGVPALRRSYFLDHHHGEGAIRAQLDSAVAAARRSDHAVVVIGHPRAETLRVLRESVPILINQGVTFVTLSQAAGLEGSGAR